MEWLLLFVGVAFNVGVLMCLWADFEDGYRDAQHEAHLDELWDDEAGEGIA